MEVRRTRRDVRRFDRVDRPDAPQAERVAGPSAEREGKLATERRLVLPIHADGAEDLVEVEGRHAAEQGPVSVRGCIGFAFRGAEGGHGGDQQDRGGGIGKASGEHRRNLAKWVAPKVQFADRKRFTSGDVAAIT